MYDTLNKLKYSYTEHLYSNYLNHHSTKTLQNQILVIFREDSDTDF